MFATHASQVQANRLAHVKRTHACQSARTEVRGSLGETRGSMGETRGIWVDPKGSGVGASHEAARVRVERALCRLVFFAATTISIVMAGCISPAVIPPKTPANVTPHERSVSADSLRLDASKVKPMYTELVPIDLYSVIRVVAAENIDIRLAKYQVDQFRGRYESAVGGAFPVVVPTAIFDHVDGSVRATEGNIVNVGFNTFQPSIAVQWVVNPGRVIYEIIASKKRLLAAQHQQRAVKLEVLRTAAIQFYNLVLSQAHVSATHQAVIEAEELFRINQLRAKTGTGVPADELRAEARLAQRQQDLALAMNDLYKASLALAVTLELDDPTVTLIPKIEELPPINLVRADLGIDDMLNCALQHRPDLQNVRLLIDAAKADRGARWWGGFGPQFGAKYQFSGITGHSNNTKKGRGIPSRLIVNPFSPTGSFLSNPVANAVTREGILRGSRRLDHNRDETFSFSDQQRFNASVGARWSLSTFGDLKAADAATQQAIVEAKHSVIKVKAQVIEAAQASKMNRKLIAMAKRQTVAAKEALRMTEASLRAGSMTTLDALQAEDAVAQARLRYAEAVVRYNQAEINLLAALGVLDAHTLGATVAQADATAHDNASADG